MEWFYLFLIAGLLIFVLGYLCGFTIAEDKTRKLHEEYEIKLKRAYHAKYNFACIICGKSLDGTLIINKPENKHLRKVYDYPEISTNRIKLQLSVGAKDLMNYKVQTLKQQMNTTLKEVQKSTGMYKPNSLNEYMEMDIEEGKKYFSGK